VERAVTIHSLPVFAHDDKAITSFTVCCRVTSTANSVANTMLQVITSAPYRAKLSSGAALAQQPFASTSFPAALTTYAATPTRPASSACLPCVKHTIFCLFILRY
jgi:hypothetical protein